MSEIAASIPATKASHTNGSGAAAILAAGIGSFLVAILALIADRVPEFKGLMIFYKPTGPLSGVTTCAIAGWLAAWAILNSLWRRRSVALGPVNVVAFLLLVLSLLLTFPPIADLL
jgi:membrane associated rhomboid family serine protease